MGSPTDRAHRLYSASAAFYETFFTGWLKWSEVLSEFFVRHQYVRSGSRILDAGCGTGAASKAIFEGCKQRGCADVTIHAFDLTEAMLASFQGWIGREGAASIRARKADALRLDSQLPPEWRDYDLIVASTLIEYFHADQVRLALSQLGRLLGPSGRLLLIVTRRNLFATLLARAWWRVRAYSSTKIERLLSDAGLRVTRPSDHKSPWNRFILAMEASK